MHDIGIGMMFWFLGIFQIVRVRFFRRRSSTRTVLNLVAALTLIVFLYSRWILHAAIRVPIDRSVAEILGISGFFFLIWAIVASLRSAPRPRPAEERPERQ